MKLAMWLVLLLAVGARAMSSAEWSAIKVVENSDYAFAPVFPANVSIRYNVAAAGECPINLDGECRLYTPNVNPYADAQTVLSSPGCDCHDRTLAWKRVEMTEAEYARLSGAADAADDDLVPGANTAGNGRYLNIAAGHSWDLSSIDTQSIVPTIDPGGTVAVSLGGDQKTFFESPATRRAQPCGLRTPDAFQATQVDTDSATPSLLPSAFPSAGYCELDNQLPVANDSGTTTGPEWTTEWTESMAARLGAVDAVCRCRLGRVPAMLEYSGVYFSNPDYETVLLSVCNTTDGTTCEGDWGMSSSLASRKTDIATTHGWTELSTYVTPLVFFCRDDYTVYWNLLFAFETMFSTDTAIGNIYVHSRQVTERLVNAPDSQLSYWKRFYMAGVDCLRELPDTTPGADPCGNGDITGPPFLPNVSIGLEIGQLFWGLNLPAVCDVASEDNVSVTDPTGCVRDFLWALASMKRRGIQGQCPDPYTATGICSNIQLFDNADLTIPASNSTFTKSLGPTSTGLHAMWGTIAPSANLFEFLAESSALFVRLAAYSADFTTSALGPVEGVDDAWYEPRALRGAECDSSMIGAETRISPDPVYHAENPGCPGRNPDGSINNTWEFDPTMSTCPGVIGIGYWYWSTTNASDATPYIYACVGDTVTNVTGCFDDGETSSNLGRPPDNPLTPTERGCQIPPEGEFWFKPFHWTNCDQQNVKYCGTNVNDWQYCQVTPGGSDNTGGVSGGNGRPCGILKTDVTASPASVPSIANYPGSVWPPVLYHPRFKGMAPRLLYNTTPDVDVACAAPLYFSPGLFNKCILFFPRPVAAGIFTGGESDAALDYRGVFFDQDRAGLPTSVDPTAPAMYGDPLLTPTASHLQWWCATGTNSEGALCTTLAVDNTTVLALHGTWLESALADFHKSESANESALTRTALVPGMPDGYVSYGGALVSVYTSLRLQRPAAIGAWTDALGLGRAPELQTYTIGSVAMTLGTSVDLCVAYGQCLAAPSGNASYRMARALVLSAAETAALRRSETRGECFTIESDVYCRIGCAGWKSRPDVAFYEWKYYCGDDLTHPAWEPVR